MKKLDVDICIIGAGSGGLSVAAGAAQMGARVALVEADRMGGDCLNSGCVPSKALLAAAKRAHAMENSDAFGIKSVKPKVDMKAVMKHVQDVIKTIEPHDSEERFEGLGAQVIKGWAKFVDNRTVQIDDMKITAKRFVLATGSKAAIPSIPGLKAVSYLTNESIFELKETPKHLVIIGGGPIGCEMAQAFARLGVKVTVLEMFSIFPRDDKDAVKVVRKQLEADGVEFHEGIQVKKVAKAKEGVSVSIEEMKKPKTIKGSHILVAAGRKAMVEGMDLERAGIKYSARGIEVDKRLRTSNKKIFAIGDVVGPYQFTHVAGYHAGIVIRNFIFRQPVKVNYEAVPWVTYTDPELAHVGMMHDEAHEAVSGARTTVVNLSVSDRCVAERHTEGFVKVTTDKKGHVLGATVVGHNAGELITPWTVRITRKLRMSAWFGFIIPYPTVSEINKVVATDFYKPIAFSKWVRCMVRFLLKWG